MLSDIERRQIDLMITFLKANPTKPYEDEIIRDFVGDAGFQHYRVLHVDAATLDNQRLKDGQRTVRSSDAIASYRDRLNTFLQQHGTMLNRLPKLYASECRDELQIESHEQFLEHAYKYVWEAYDKLSVRDKTWCERAPGQRLHTNQPRVPYEATFEYLFPNEPYPAVKAQMKILEKLLNE